MAEFADAAIRESWVTDKGLTVFSLWNPRDPGSEIDLFVREPFDFDAVHARAVRVTLDSTIATVISIEDLIELKQGAGRPRDLEDIEALRAIQEDSVG